MPSKVAAQSKLQNYILTREARYCPPAAASRKGEHNGSSLTATWLQVGDLDMALSAVNTALKDAEGSLQNVDRLPSANLKGRVSAQVSMPTAPHGCILLRKLTATVCFGDA